MAGTCVAFQYHFTGDVIATSILSRRVLAMPSSIALGPITFDPTFAKRLLIYLPLTGLFLWSWWRDRVTVRPTERFLRLLFAAFFVIYSITGTPQLARYVIFLMPILVIGAVRGARTLWRNRRSRPVLAIAVVAIVALDLAEPWYRTRLYGWGLLKNAIAGPARRTERTDKLLADLGGPTQRPIVVATESVQIRYELDERIVVRSLDGRVDRSLLAFVGGEVVDHVGYLGTRRVAYLLQARAYNRDRSAWSLANLLSLKPGESAQQGGLRFQHLASGRYAITPR
jgi:hypothetical protein